MPFVRKIFSLLLIVSGLLAMDAESITGQVRDVKTGEPMANVNIFIENDGLGTTTDENGHFSLSGLSAGEHVVEFSHIGYSIHYEMVKIPFSGTLQVKLMRALIQMDAMVVTGTRTERYLKDTPVTTQVIKGEKLTDSGAADLSQLLQIGRAHV